MEITFDLEEFGLTDANVGPITEGLCIVTATIEAEESWDRFKRRVVPGPLYVEDCDFEATLGIGSQEADKAISAYLKKKYGFDEVFRKAVNDQAMRELVKEQAA